MVVRLSGRFVQGRGRLEILQTNSRSEVSRQIHVELDRGFLPELNEEAQLPLNHEGVRKNTFAFHSSSEPGENTDVIIRFNDTTIIRHVKTFNRRDAQFHHRAKGMWTSMDKAHSIWTES